MKSLELTNYGVVEMSEIEQLGIEGEGKLPSWNQIKQGGKWLYEKAIETCAGNCAASWVEGFIKEMAS